MVDTGRMTKEFLELLNIDSLSLQERAMTDSIRKKLEEIGLDVYEDDVGPKIGGNSGNLIASMKGNEQRPSVLLSAHLDTVSPGKKKRPYLKDGIFLSDGTTILGGDNMAGIEIILETLRILTANDIEHGDITVIFSVAEELGLLGASNIEFEKIHADYGIVLDCAGKPGIVALRAPVHYDIDVHIKGKAAHAGIEPEKGISAIKIAGEALAKMKLGRVNADTTANIGIISGGNARNTICDYVELKGEARSLDEEHLKAQIAHMKKCFEDAAAMYMGEVIFHSYMKYPVLNIREESPIISILKNAAHECGLKLNFISTGGGSDANIFSNKDIQTVNIAIGMENMHTTEEKISLEDMKKSVQFLLSIFRRMN